MQGDGLRWILLTQTERFPGSSHGNWISTICRIGGQGLKQLRPSRDCAKAACIFCDKTTHNMDHGNFCEVEKETIARGYDKKYPTSFTRGGVDILCSAILFELESI